MKLNEIAGHGSTRTDILKDCLFLWEANNHTSLPTKVTFRYPLPSHYSHFPSGEQFRLPSSYEAHLNGMPGFRVEVSYAIVIYITRTRERTDWWRRNSRYGFDLHCVTFCVSLTTINLGSRFPSSILNVRALVYLDRFLTVAWPARVIRKRYSNG
jgi:hypothetical protein